MAASKHGSLLYFLMCFSLSFCVITTTTRPDEQYETDSHSIVRSCNIEEIKYLLTKLEVLIGEKFAQLNSELRESNRRLQALEMQSVKTHSFVYDLRTEITRLTKSNLAIPSDLTHDNQRENDKLESKLENLERDMQSVVVALPGLRSDVNLVKTNISEIVNITSKLLQQYDDLHPPTLANLFRDANTGSANGTRYPKNCLEVLENGETDSGTYLIRPEQAQKPFMVFCDMEEKDGGWTYIHDRFDGSQDFYLKWHDYKTGFGNIEGESWLGLEHIHQLTGQELNELLVVLTDVNGFKVHAHYATFSIGSETEGYPLKVLGDYNGTAGDLLRYHAGAKFSTVDRDQDTWVGGNCALDRNSAWWYKNCDASDLNRKYFNWASGVNRGMYWGDFRGPRYIISQASMLIRPKRKKSPPLGIAGNRSTPIIE